MLTYTISVSGASVWPCTDLLNESVQIGFCCSRMQVVLFLGAPSTRHLSAALTNGWFSCGVAALAVSLAEAYSVFCKGHKLLLTDKLSQSTKPKSTLGEIIELLREFLSSPWNIYKRDH